MGVVGLPSRVTGLAAISISEEITFMPGCHASSNSSQRDSAAGVAWRLILMMTDLFAIFPDSSHSWSRGRPRPGAAPRNQSHMPHCRSGGQTRGSATSCAFSLRRINTSSPVAESATYPPVQTQTSAHPHRARKLLSSSSGNSCRRARGNLVCSAPREIRRADVLPGQSRATTAACCKAGG